MVRRTPAAIVPIRDIHSHPRVAIVGAVITKSEYSITIDDGTAQIEAMLTGEEEPEIKDIVRVTGRVIGDSIETESLRIITDLNIDLYKKSIGVIGRYHTL